MSMTASGKLGNAIAFSVWKGAAYVRQFVIPSNPKSNTQGDNRIILGGTGRAVGKVSVGSNFETKLMTLGVIPSGQSKQSFLVKYILSHYLETVTNFNSEVAAVTGHSAYTAFSAAATTLGITEFDLSYASAAGPYNKALGVYELAKTAIALGFTGAPYTVTLASWTATQVNLLVADLQ